MMKLLVRLGSRLWENHGYWIDKENNIIQENYHELPLLGKIGYNLMILGLRRISKGTKQIRRGRFWGKSFKYPWEED